MLTGETPSCYEQKSNEHFSQRSTHNTITNVITIIITTTMFIIIITLQASEVEKEAIVVFSVCQCMSAK